jgi:hypothetical protein
LAAAIGGIDANASGAAGVGGMILVSDSFSRVILEKRE